MQKTILYLKPILKLLPHCARQLLTEASLETISLIHIFICLKLNYAIIG